MKNLGAIPPVLPVDLTHKSYVDGLINNVPSYAVGAAKRFDPATSSYNWKASNTRRLRRSLNRATTGGQDDWIVIGASLEAGCTGNNGAQFDRINNWPALLGKSLAAKGIPLGGSGLKRHSDSVDFFDSIRYTNFTGTWSSAASFTVASTAGASFVFNPQSGENGSTFFVETYVGFGGTMTISVDGATSGTNYRSVTLPSTGFQGWQQYKLTGLRLIGGVSKITVTFPTLTGAGASYFRGAGVGTPNSGLTVHNLAQSGSRASGTGNASWTDVDSGVGKNMKTGGVQPARTLTDVSITNGSNIVTSASGAFTQDDIGLTFEATAAGVYMLFPANTIITSIDSATQIRVSNQAVQTQSNMVFRVGKDPSVVFIDLGINDIGAGFSISAIVSALQTIVGWYPNSDIVLINPHEAASSLIATATQDAYSAAQFVLADTLDCPLIDIKDRVGRYAQAQPLGIYGDQIHLSDYAAYAETIAETISGLGGNRLQVETPVNTKDVATKGYVDSLNLSILPITAAQTAAPNIWYRANATSSGSYTLTLPAVPYDGAFLIVENTGTSNIVSFVRGGTDTIEGSTASFDLNPSEFAELTYRAVDAQWYMRRGLYGPNPGTLMRRDNAGRAQVVSPSAANDIVNKTYADALGTNVNTFSTIMRRDSTGRSQVSTPTAANDAANKSYVDALNMYVVPVTAAVSPAVAGTWYRADPTTAGFTVTLPSAPAEGTDIVIENVATSGTNQVSYVRGGTTDTIEGSTATLTLNPTEFVELTYRAANAQWYQRRAINGPTAGTLVRRDIAGRLQVADPSVAADVATKNYVDTKRLSTTFNGPLVLSTTSSFYLSGILLPANTLAVGDTIKISLTFSNTTATAQTLSPSLRAGTTNSAADSAQRTVTLAAGTAAAGNGRLEFYVTWQAIGTAVFPVVEHRWFNGTGTTGISATQMAGDVAASTNSINTTANLYYGVTVSSSVANIVTVRTMTAELIRKA